MKKIFIASLVGLVVVGGVFTVTPAVEAQTSGVPQLAQLSSIVSKLQAQIEALKKKVEELRKVDQQSSVSATLSPSKPPSVTPPIPSLPTNEPLKVAVPPTVGGGENFVVLDELPGNPYVSCKLPVLKFGSRHDAVFLLQMLLNKSGHYPEGLITGYFGKRTQAAVERFQKANNISLTGMLDDTTLGHIQKIMSQYFEECGRIQPVPPRSDTFKGLLKVSGPSIQMWGTHILDASDIDRGSYRVQAASDEALNSLKKFENRRVVISGKAEYLNLEGGFWALTAHKVALIDNVIQPPTSKIQFYSPAYGEEWRQGHTYKVAWTGGSKRVELTLIDLSIAAASASKSWISGSFENVGTYPFFVPSNLKGKYQFYISDGEGGFSSSNPFSIVSIVDTPPPSAELKVYSPGYGEEWYAGKSYVIRWSVPPSPLGKAFELVSITLEPPQPSCPPLSLGATCAFQLVKPYVIVKGAMNNGSYEWKVPSDLPEMYRGKQQITVQVQETGVSGMSALFSIVGSQVQPPVTGQIQVNSPAGGEEWQVGKTYAIGWNTTGVSTQFWYYRPWLSLVDEQGTTVVKWQANDTFVNKDDYRFGRTSYIVSDSGLVGKKLRVRVWVGDDPEKPAYEGWSGGYISVTSGVVERTCRTTTETVRRAPLYTREFSNLGLDTSSYPEIMKYRIQWFSGGWSEWYTPGVDDVDWKNDGVPRRVWAYFGDHNHEFVKCNDFAPSSENKSPVIVGVGGPTTLRVGEVGTWNVSAYDPEGGYLYYGINWGDGYPASASESVGGSAAKQESSFTHSYVNAGTYKITFTVKDDKGATAVSTVTVSVAANQTNTPPKITASPVDSGGTLNAVVGQGVSLGWKALDPDNDYLSWIVKWGDGTNVSSVSGGCSTYESNCSLFQTWKAWTAPGSYLVGVEVSDGRGGGATHGFTVIVSGSTAVN
ncbi:peptidoglycan-binding protein [Candidatus Jorgensenbacteria bacterium]|nr:peptidoglycan-binding protein [Candidatus Jorgensenbacteria bacterium]